MALLKVVTALILAFCFANAHAQIIVTGNNNDSLLSNIADGASRAFDTKGPIFLTIRECGSLNAAWDRSQQIVICQEVLAHAKADAQSYLQRGLVSQESAIKMALGQIFYTVLHELAHALIQRHQLPYTGRQEDVADQFAANVLLTGNDADMYIGAINFMSQLDRKRIFNLFSKKELSDEHALSAQRKFQMICWAYGQNPQRIHQMALSTGMSQQRLNRCHEEYADMKRNTERIFSVTLKKQQ